MVKRFALFRQSTLLCRLKFAGKTISSNKSSRINFLRSSFARLCAGSWIYCTRKWKGKQQQPQERDSEKKTCGSFKQFRLYLYVQDTLEKGSNIWDKSIAQNRGDWQFHLHSIRWVAEIDSFGTVPVHCWCSLMKTLGKRHHRSRRMRRRKMQTVVIDCSFVDSWPCYVFRPINNTKKGRRK